MAKNDETFIHHVQLHERTWGMENYPGRPRLDDILKAPVVAFWYPISSREYRYSVTLHRSLQEVEDQLVKMLLHTKAKLPERRLSRLFVKGQQVRIKGLKVQWENVEGIE